MKRALQPSLFDAPPQPRRRGREDERLWLAVLYLRLAGAKVYRAGRDMHSVNGVRVTTGELMERAGA